MADLCNHFPGTEEMAAQIVADWIESQLEMLRRLARDRKRLMMISPAYQSHLRIASFSLDLSDLHDSGRSVLTIKFENGACVIYKPRDSCGERIWFGALRWMNENGFVVRFRIPRMLFREKYFLMALLRHKECKNSKAVKRFYYCWGAQSAVSQILGMEDLHRGNWIATATQPVLLDAEMVSYPSSRSSAVARNWAGLNPLLRTGLLPIFDKEKVGLYSGIAPLDSSFLAHERLNCWPHLDGQTNLPSVFSSDVVRGYRAVMHFFADYDQRRKFSAQINKLSRHAEYRVLYRATGVYYAILRSSYSPKRFLQRGSRMRHLRLACAGGSVARQIETSEAQALFRGCIPRFVGRSLKRNSAVPILFFADSSRLLRARLTSKIASLCQARLRSLRPVGYAWMSIIH
ncbi:MAG: DUF4135 domain-containing protein [Chthoniobacterales bacterium]